MTPTPGGMHRCLRPSPDVTHIHTHREDDDALNAEQALHEKEDIPEREHLGVPPAYHEQARSCDDRVQDGLRHDGSDGDMGDVGVTGEM